MEIKISKTKSYFIILWLLLIFGLHSDIPFNYAGIAFPSLISLIFFILILNKFNLNKNLILLVVIFSLMSLISYIFKASNHSVEDFLRSFFQILFCIFFSYGVKQWIERNNFNSNFYYKLIEATLFLLVTMVILEWLGVISNISNEFGLHFYTGNVGFEFYGANEYALNRDEQLSGGRRPTLFSPEPSIPAITLTVFTIIYSFFSKGKKILISIAVLFLVWFIFNSPTPLLGVLIVVLGKLLKAKELTNRLILTIFTTLLGIGIFPLIYIRLSRVFSEHEGILTTSEGIRLILPFLNAYNSIKNGAYLGNSPGVLSDINYIKGLNPYGSPMFGTNNIALIFLYFGPVFSLFLFYLYWKTFKIKENRYSSYILGISTIVLLGFSLGAIESVRFLGYWSLIMVFWYISNGVVNGKKY